MNENQVVVSGTIAEMLAQGLTANGHVVDNAQLSVLTRLYGKPVGVVPKVGRGRKSTIWELGNGAALNLSVAAVQAPVQDDAAPEPSAPVQDDAAPEPSAETETVEAASTQAETSADDASPFPWGHAK